MDEENSASEDEWASIQKRFKREGLDWDTTEGNQKSLQLFRWLVDAEANLKASRNINDKLRKQQDEEKKEWKKYSDHLKQKCENHVKEIENERRVLKDDLEALLTGTQAVSNIFRQEGLEDIANSSLGDQIAYLLVERSQLLDDLKEFKGEEVSSISSTENKLSTSKIKTERDILKLTNEEIKNKANEMSKRIAQLEKALKQAEDDNECLAFKLSETLVEIEDKERLIYHLEGNGSTNAAVKKDSTSEPCSMNFSLSKSNEKGKPNRADKFLRRPSDALWRQDSTDSKSEGCASPHKLNSLLDSQILNSKSHLTHLNDVKKLQNEVERLKMNYLKVGRKYEEIFKKYETLKLKSENQIEMITKEQEWQMDEVNNELKVMKDTIERNENDKKEEENFRKRIENDLKELREERLQNIHKESEILRQVKKIEEENLILQKKLHLFEEEIKDLNEKFRKSIIKKIENE